MDVAENIRKVAVEHHRSGLSIRKIARNLNLPKSTIGNIIKRYSNTGEISSRRRGRCGRPNLLTVREERSVCRASTMNPQATARELQACVGGNVVRVSVDTIKRTLRKHGKLAYRPMKSPFLTPNQKAVRVQWCRQYQHWAAENWRKVS